MCGNFAGPDLEEAEVDGAVMYLCPKCAKFGTRLSDKRQQQTEETEVTFVKSKPGGKGSSTSHVKVKTGGTSTRQPARRRYRDALDIDEVLIEDYGEVIKTARKARGLSLDDFAQMINEKTSLLQKIEKGEFNPPDQLITKIERKLKISLKEEMAPTSYTSLSSKKDTTLGDVVKLRKKKK